MRRLGAAFNRSAEMGVGNLKAVLVGHGFRVAQPCSRYMDREGFHQFGLSTGSQVLVG
jgi:hypothetical protein